MESCAQYRALSPPLLNHRRMGIRNLPEVAEEGIEVEIRPSGSAHCRKE